MLAVVMDHGIMTRTALWWEIPAEIRHREGHGQFEVLVGFSITYHYYYLTMKSINLTITLHGSKENEKEGEGKEEANYEWTYGPQTPNYYDDCPA